MHSPFACAQKSEWFLLFPSLFLSLSLTLSVLDKATHVCVLAKPACPHRRVLSLNPPNNPMILCAYNPLAMLLPDLGVCLERCACICVFMCACGRWEWEGFKLTSNGDCHIKNHMQVCLIHITAEASAQSGMFQKPFCCHKNF